MAAELSCIELFAGCGGMALGLEQAGFRQLAAVERDHWACGTLRRNRPQWNVAEQDIRETDFSAFRGVCLAAGGPPCQAFSYAGKRLGFKDDRGTLFAEFARCLKEARPRAFLFENVKGLLRHDRGRTFAAVLEAFEGLGYAVRQTVMDASLHGAGQRRERLLLAGFRDGAAERFAWPEPDARAKTLREVLKDCPEGPGASYSKAKRAVLALVPEGGCWTDLPEDAARAYLGGAWKTAGGKRGIARRTAWDAPCPTLMTSPMQKLTERCHPSETRPFTVREYARIQCFPDSWEFCGSMAAQYRQIGNAMPVEPARRIGTAMAHALAGGTETD